MAAYTATATVRGTRANETMIRAVAVFVGRAVRGATSVTTGRRPEAAEGTFRGLSPGGECGSDGRREALRGKGC